MKPYGIHIHNTVFEESDIYLTSENFDISVFLTGAYGSSILAWKSCWSYQEEIFYMIRYDAAQWDKLTTGWCTYEL